MPGEIELNADTNPCPTCRGPVARRSKKGRFPTYCSRRCQERRPTARVKEYEKARAERAAARLSRPARGCAHCGDPFVPRRSDQAYCQGSCATRARDARRSEERAAVRVVPSRSCAGCGEQFTPLPNNAAKQQYCGKRCQLSAHKLRYRARLAAVTVERFDIADVYERDCWICQICQEPIDRDARAPHPWSRSIDHRIPLARGGAHSLENCQAAHLWCNSAKKDHDLSLAG